MLDVYLYDALVGQVRKGAHDLLSFQYGERALDEPEMHRLSVRMPVRAEPYDHQATLVFFENLLPEGEGRDLIAQARHHSPADVAGLLGMIGGECAGAVSLWPTGLAPAPEPAYRPLSASELAALFDQEYGPQVTEMQIAERLSMSGAQQKMLFRRRGDGFELPLHGAPSNVIIKRAKPAYPGLVLNELACMRLIQACGFRAAESRAVGADRLLFESLRYDRNENDDGTLLRLHQEDFCQATGRRPAEKYQARGGPAYGDLVRVIRGYGADPLRDLETLTRWAMFNIIVGNNDAHAKNLSLLYLPNGPSLAPMYDLVSTELYPHLDRQFSIEVGGRKTAAGLHRAALDKFARSVGIKAAGVRQMGLALAAQARAELPAVLHRIASEHEHDPILDQLHDLVIANASLLEDWLMHGATR